MHKGGSWYSRNWDSRARDDEMGTGAQNRNRKQNQRLVYALLLASGSLTSDFVTAVEATLTKFLPCLLYLLPEYLGLLTSAAEHFKVNDVLGGGLISGYPGMGVFYVMLLFKLMKKRERKGDFAIPLLRTRVLARLCFLPSSHRTRRSSPPVSGRVVPRVCFSLGWDAPRVDSPWRVVENSRKDRWLAVLEVVSHPR